MLEDIKIAKVASYGADGQTLNGLKAINFIFGTNGTGKTTISRVLRDASPYPGCSLTWRKSQPIELLVYNRDFVTENFVTQMRGIFTLGKIEGDTEQKIQEGRDAVSRLLGEIAQLKGTLGRDDGSPGKLTDKKAARSALEDYAWKIKQRHDGHFAGAFTGLRNSQARFCDKVLEELGANTANLIELEALKARAVSLFGDDPERELAIPVVDTTEILAAHADPILSKKIIGKEDVDVAGLIRRLGNSDWVRHGIGYLGEGDRCPFCQQQIEDDLAEKLGEYFDETYSNDLAAVDRLIERYEVHSARIAERLSAIAASGIRHMDAESFRANLERLLARVDVNRRLLEGKKKEPSSVVSLEAIDDLLNILATQIAATNVAIEAHNTLVSNLATERERLKREIWRCLLAENDPQLGQLDNALTAAARAVEGIQRQIATKESTLEEARTELRALEKTVTSVRPTVDAINGLLNSFGFTGFKLRTAGEQDQLYEIVRDDGGDAVTTLSEGERSFVSFLYFYHLLRGSTTESGTTSERVIVFDDPISSMDSDVLFIVSALIKRVLKEACSKTGQIKQVFVLTHNIYFHKEVSFDPDRGAECRTHETFWIIRKVDGVSVVKSFPTNPIKTSYEMLWEEVRNPDRSKLTIQNTLRRILENYFKILGSIDKDTIIAKFEGRDQAICSSLFAWVNDGSHNAHDELYVSVDEGMTERYLSVFEEIFKKTDHAGHYKMMMKIKDAEPKDELNPEETVQAAA